VSENNTMNFTAVINTCKDYSDIITRMLQALNNYVPFSCVKCNDSRMSVTVLINEVVNKMSMK